MVVLTTVGAAVAPFSRVAIFVYCEPKNSFGGTLLDEPLSLSLDLPDEFTCLDGKSSTSSALESTFGTVLVDSQNYYILKYK